MRIWALAGVSCVTWFGCTGGQPAPAPSGEVAPSASAATNPLPADSAAEPVVSAQPAAMAASAQASAAASASEVVAAPPALVTVKNIGLHIGGGPNDTPTKAPIKRSFEPHFDAVAACFEQAEDKTKVGDISLDLKIPKEGGTASLQKYKSAIVGADFETCVRNVVLAIDFEKPKGGTTVASYSLRLTLKKDVK